jgi:hypothetical protein
MTEGNRPLRIHIKGETRTSEPPPPLDDEAEPFEGSKRDKVDE